MTDTVPPTPSKAAQALLVGGSASPPPEGQLASSPWRLGALAAVVAAIGVAFGWGWVVIIGALTVMIFLHELGHFVTAKWAGMKVTEFCILGVGPKLWSVRRGETEYMIRLIPIAAYVRIVGMNNLDETDPADEPRTFRQQSFPKRVVVMSGGSAMHFLQAFVLFVVVFAFVGVPGDMQLSEEIGGPAPRWGVGELVEDGAAEKAGIRAGDEIVSIDGKDVDLARRGAAAHRRPGRRPPPGRGRARRRGPHRLRSWSAPTRTPRRRGFLGVRVGDLPSSCSRHHRQPGPRRRRGR